MLAAQEVHVVAAQRERLAQLGGDDAAAADRRVTDDADVHVDGASRAAIGAQDRLAHDDAFGPRDAGERAELRVAALDELAERGAFRRVAAAPVAGGANWLAWQSSAWRFRS